MYYEYAEHTPSQIFALNKEIFENLPLKLADIANI